jgi:hypothetical protein
VLTGVVRSIGGIDVKRTRQVQIQGRARARGILFCPLSNRPVIGYRIRIEAFGRSRLGWLGTELVPATREGSGSWYTLVEITRLQEFEIFDDSGSAFIHWLGPLLLAETRAPTELADVVIRPEFYETVDADMEMVTGLLRIDPDEGRFVARSVLAGNDRVRCWATTIEHNSEVFVCGRPVVRLNPHGESAGYREAPNPLVIRSAGGNPLLVANCNKSALIETLDSRLTD